MPCGSEDRKENGSGMIYIPRSPALPFASISEATAGHSWRNAGMLNGCFTSFDSLDKEA